MGRQAGIGTQLQPCFFSPEEKNAARTVHCAIVKNIQESKNWRDKSTGKNFAQRGVYCVSNQSGFLRRDDEGGGEEDMVAVYAVDAALRGIGEDVFVEGGSAD